MNGAGGRSVSTVSGYGLDDRAIEVRSPAEAGDVSSKPVSKPALGPTQPPVQWVPRVLSPGVKRGRGVTLTTHPQLVPRSWRSRSYTSSTSFAAIGVLWDCFTCFLPWMAPSFVPSSSSQDHDVGLLIGLHGISTKTERSEMWHFHNEFHGNRIKRLV
jgi:hypothetical protein